MTIKVAHLTTVDMSVRHLLLNQLLALREAGFDVTAISAPGPDLGPVAAAGIRHLPVAFTRRMTPLTDLKAMWQLWRIFRHERFTIVHTHQAKAALMGQMAARLARVPIIVNTLHGFYFHDRTPRLKRALWIAIEKYQALFSDRILSQNPEDVETAVTTGICARDKIEFLGNGIDLRRFDPKAISPETRRRIRAELGLGDDVKLIGFVGRLVREKGIVELFDAFRQVRERIPTAKLLVIGPVDTDGADVVSPRSAALVGVADHVMFPGYRHDMPELYSIMDVCVLPSHREGFPRSPMEASAMGVPCVATNIRGCRQVVLPERNGFLVRVGDAPALGDAIVRILDNRDLAAQLSQGGIQLAAESFDERTVFASVADAYRRLLTQRGLTTEVAPMSQPAHGA